MTQPANRIAEIRERLNEAGFNGEYLDAEFASHIDWLLQVAEAADAGSRGFHARGLRESPSDEGFCLNCGDIWPCLAARLRNVLQQNNQ